MDKRKNNPGPAPWAAPDEIARLYLDGAPIVGVAAVYGVSYGVARRALLAAGVTLRPTGAPSHCPGWTGPRA